MDINEIFRKMAEQRKLQNTAMTQSFDRMSMDGSDKQGPHLPDVTPEEQEYYGNIGQAVTGSVGKLPEDPSKVVAAKNILNKVYDSGAKLFDVAKSQQSLSRELDFANRARQQKFDRIKKLFGN